MVTSSPIKAVSGPTQIGLGEKEDGPGHEAGDCDAGKLAWRERPRLPGPPGKALLGEMLPKWVFSQGKAAASETHTAPVSPTRLKIILTFMCSCLNYIFSLLASLFII